MKTTNVTEFKAHLSRYLRLALQGMRIVVTDQDEPIAQIGPPEPAPLSWRERLARENRLTVGTQQWDQLEVSRPKSPIDIQESLSAIRGDAGEVRTR